MDNPFNSKLKSQNIIKRLKQKDTPEYIYMQKYFVTTLIDIKLRMSLYLSKIEKIFCAKWY